MPFELVDLLPGLHVLIVATALVWVLRRWYDPVPTRALVVFALVMVLLFGQVLFFGGILLPLDNLRNSPPFQDLARSQPSGFWMQADQLEDFAPYFAQVRRSLATGEWPLLNPLVGAGEPLLVNTQAQHFHPLMALTYVLPLSQALGAIAALKVLVAMLFFFVLCRRLGLGEEAALSGSLAYGLSGFMLLYLGWPQTQSAAVLPLMLYALEGVITRRARQDWVLLGVASITLLLAGHPETMLYAMTFSGAFAIVRLAASPRHGRLRTIGWMVSTAVLAAGLVAPVLVPTVLYGKSSERYEHAEARRHDLLATTADLRQRLSTPEARATEAEKLVKRSLPLIAPHAYGNNRYGRYWGATAIFQDASGFVGSATLLAALLALWPVGRHRRFPAERLSVGAAAVSLLIFIQPPGMKALLAALPILGHSASYHRRISLLLCFCVAFLAACAWERWRRQGVAKTALIPIAGILVVLVIWAYIAHPDPDNPETQAGQRQRSATVQLVTLMAAGALFCQRRQARAWAPWTMGLLVAVELWTLHGDLNPAMPKRLYFPQRPTIDFLQQHLGNDRMVALGKTFRYNLPVIYGLADVRSGNPLQPSRLFRLTKPVRESGYGRRFVKADHPIYDLLGVRYVVVGPKKRLPRPLRPIFKGQAWIYERPHPLPRLFLPATAHTVDESLLFDEVLAITDFAHQAIVESLPTTAGEAGWRASRNSGSSVELLELAATRVRARAKLAETRLLASSLYQDGGWQLLVDGHHSKTVLTNGTFVGAWLEEGEHTLELIYRPPGFLFGCLLAALASTTVLLLWIQAGRPSAAPDQG